MKNLVSILLISILLFSCSNDPETESASKASVLDSNAVATGALPKATSNPKDGIGKKYYDALRLYADKNPQPGTTDALAAQITFIANRITTGKTTDKKLIVFTDQIVQAIMDDPDNSLIAIVQNSSLSATAKTNLISFLQHLLLNRDQGFTVLYNYISAYESLVLSNTSLSSDEKDTLLSVTSISTYSLYSEAERKDRDWETSVGSKMARPFLKSNEMSIITTISLLKLFL